MTYDQFKEKLQSAINYPFFREFIHSGNTDINNFNDNLDQFRQKIGFDEAEIKLLKRLGKTMAKLSRNEKLKGLINGLCSEFMIFGAKGKIFSIEPLSQENLAEAIELANRVFTREKNNIERASVAFPASLIISQGGFKAFFLKPIMYFYGRSDLNYWIIMDNDRQKVVGFTGLYCLKEDKHEADWGGWTCVDENYRPYYGLAWKIKEFIIAKIKSRGKKYLRLFTSTHPGEATANVVYDRLGFKIFKRSPIKGTNLEMLYREKKI
ncbi:hypothetical protein HYV80_03315 [Candidatus Woesearchaeota archaeon]|nr:hypothetical protein [Candidatus Woesearchaeota archaeon]